LRNSRALFRIAAVVFSQQFEFCFFAAYHHAFCIQLFDRHFGAVFIVFT
jgi:hypothetical protein